MLDFPTATTVHRRMPKDAFYRNLSLTKALKEKFISDVDRIFVENSLTTDNLNLTKKGKIQEIMLLSMTLKKPDLDGKVMEAIAKQNSHELIFLLMYENLRQLALYHGKLYRAPWTEEENLTLTLSGYSLDEIWDSMMEQIALFEERIPTHDRLSLEERLALQERMTALEKQIAKTEAAVWKEQQPKKKFDLHTQLQAYKKELERLQHGQS